MVVRLWEPQLPWTNSRSAYKYEAEQAEIKIRRDVFEGKYGKQFGTTLLQSLSAIPLRQTISLVRARFWIGPGTTNDRGSMISFACARCFELSPVKR